MTSDTTIEDPRTLTWREKYALERAKRLRPDGPAQVVVGVEVAQCFEEALGC